MSGKSFHIPSVEQHFIESRYVDQMFQIQVMQPLMERGTHERFPVLYLSDANLAFDAARSICHYLQAAGQVRRFILVGIGYPGDHPFAGHILRLRDFTSDWRAEHADVPRVPPFDGVAGIEAGKKRWHGADDFLAFIRHELIPLVASSYAVIPEARAYFGHSAGAGLGTHVLFAQSDLFNSYMLSSPSVVYGNDDFGLREARAFFASGRRLDAKVVMTVGAREELDPTLEKMQFVSGVCRLAALMNNARIPGLDFTCRIIPGQTHAGVWPIAFSDGVQAIYGPAERSPLGA